MSKRVALVLGSGGARGYAHIGVIDELLARGYEIGCIAGCSMGAVVGGIYATGKLDEYREWTESLDYLDVLRLLDVSFRLGAIRGEKVFGKIHEILGEINIEDLPIPFTAVATDLTNQQEIWFQEGDLHQAMRASAAIPSLFTPVVQGNRILVDGGLLNPLPIVPVVASHCDLIVAVNLNATNQTQYELPVITRTPVIKGRFDNLMSSIGSRLPTLRRKSNDAEDLEESDEQLLIEANQDSVPAEAINPWQRRVEEDTNSKSNRTNASGTRLAELHGPASLLELVNQSFEVMQTSLAQYKIAGYPPDILINVPKRICRFFEFYRAPELIQLGRQIASDTLDKYERGER
ncbi:patatin-like phospholipase family protein [Pseudomonas sp. TTU2014-080ASC]|jgi:NTE family protein|uniref:patatin-like phospholipase family protein n=1 Tax=Pseudomonas sp. TTU2014-080ASC TaxID=1729724 RepID=UPI0007187F39|nr:patatin-like phospholipase family protein [Pseudomonas sp. TTU2014-080ASC]KRW59815.1 alpha/beta hydrolase [Pseudomonas sp. TTU2014-080ASC]